jgi:exonuclease III
LERASGEEQTSHTPRVRPNANRSDKKHLHCIYANVDSLSNKLSELSFITVNYSPDVIALSEVLPKNSRFRLTEAELQLENYDLFTNFALPSAHRGVALYIRNTMKPHYSSFKPNGAESVWCEINLVDRDKLLLGCVYRSPNINAQNDEEINDTLKDAAAFSSHVLIMGDFNHPELDWLNTTSPMDHNHRASRFMEANRDSFLYQHVNKPTHIRGDQTPNILDLVFSSEQQMVQNLEHNAPIGKSHHQILSFNFQAYTAHTPSNRKCQLVYHKGDYASFNSSLNSTNWEEMIGSLNTNQAWAKTEEVIQQLVSINVPKKKPYQQSKTPPKWMNKATSDKIKQKRKAYTKYLETRSQEDYRTYSRYRNQVKTHCRKAVRDFTKSLASEVKENPKAFYSYVRSRTKTREGIPDLKDCNEVLVSDDADKAKVLNNYFTSVFTADNDQQLPVFLERHFDHTISTAEITPDEVKKKLQHLKPNKSPGPDHHHPHVFKEAADSLAKPLSIIFNKSLNESTLPGNWKQANISPIFKKGDKNLPSNYRPVSLTSIVCKVLEMLIRDRIVEHMSRNNLFSNFQHGFIKGRSCVTNLLAVLDSWTEAIDNGQPVDTIYLDLAKAFDKVSHQKLLHKIW